MLTEIESLYQAIRISLCPYQTSSLAKTKHNATKNVYKDDLVPRCSLELFSAYLKYSRIHYIQGSRNFVFINYLLSCF